MAAKRQTAAAFTEAVCRAGWSLTSQAAAALAASWVLTLCDAPDVRMRGNLWATASVLAHGFAAWQGEEGDMEADALPPGVLLPESAFQTAFLGQVDDSITSKLPRAFDLVDHLLG